MIKRFINYVALLVLLAVCYSTTQATPLVKLRIGERSVVGNTYYADIMADVATGETWKMSGVFLISYNPAALDATAFNFFDYPEEEIASKIIYNLYPAVLARVGAAPGYNTGDYPRAAQFGMDNVNNMFYLNLAYMGNTNEDEPVQGTIRIGTLRFTIVNPLELDNIQILDQVNNENVAVIPQVVNGNIDVETLNFLTYGCDALTCYQIENPTPRQIIPPTPNITTGTVTGPFCPGVTTNITFTTPVAFNEGNVFTAQLSDATGSFTTATTIGTLTGTESGTVECTIPALATAGTNYRIRVIGSDPVNNGSNNGTDIVINALPTVSEIMSPNPEYCPTSDGSAIIGEGSGLVGISYQLFKDDVAFGDAITVEQDGDDLFWSDLYAGTYTVVATNASGCTTEMTGEVEITEAALPTVLALAPATASYCADVNGVTLTLAGSELGVSYQLKNNGENVGTAKVGTGNDLVWENMLAGNYTVEAAFGTECILAFEGSAVVTENALPTVQALTPSANAYCAGVNGVTLTLTDSEAGISYQLFNGANVAGEAKVGTGEAIEWANVLEGTYTVLATNVANNCGRTITANPVVITSTPLPTATISGNATVSISAPATYTTAVTENATYAWTVTNGTIDGEADEASVNVIWGNEAGNATVSLTKTVNGCSVDATYDVAITEFTVPTLQAKYMIFSGVGQEQMTIRWTRGNGDKVLVVAYPGTAVTTAPTMTTEYAVNEMIGTGKVVYVGTGKQVTLTGLTPGETYTFKAYEYFSNANNTGIYTLVDAVFNPRSKSTIPSVPTMNEVANITPSSADLSWTYNGALSYFEVEVATDNAFENIVNGWQGADVGDMTELTIGELAGTTEYFFRVRAVNGYYTSAWATTQFTTIDEQPTTLPSDITFVYTTDEAISAWFVGVPSQKYLVIASKVAPTEANPVPSPVDGTDYNVNEPYGNGFVVSNSDLFAFDAIDLDPATMYYFTIFTYNDVVSTNYNPEGVTASKTTLATAPTVAPTAMVFDNVIETSMNVSWTPSTDATRYIVLGVDEANANTAFDFVNGTEYTTDSPDATVLFVGTETEFDATLLQANTAYTFQVYAFNGADATTNYLTTPLVGTQVTMKDAPDAPATLTFANITPTSATVNFAKGTRSEKTVVYMNTTNSFTAPTQGTEVMPEDANVVYVGEDNSFALTDLELNPETQYFFAAYSVNGTEELSNYSSSAIKGNFTTLAEAPVNPPTVIEFTNVNEESMDVSWTPSEDAIETTRYIVLGVDEANADNAFNFVNGTEYTTESTDATVLYVGTANTFKAEDLVAGTAYTFQVYAFNGAEETTNYLTTPLVGTQVTMPLAPTEAPSDLRFSAITPESATVSFTKATDGEYTVVYMNTTGDFTTLVPAKGTEVVEGGNIVYVGDASTFNVSGLEAGEEYFFAAYSFNDNHGENVNTAELANYFATPSTTVSFTTLVEAPAPSAAVTYDNVTTTSMDIAWTSEEGATSIVLMNKTGVFATPDNGAEFDNSDIIYVGTETELAIEDLLADTKYYFAVYNVKGENGTQNYSEISEESFRFTLVEEPNAPTTLATSNITNVSMDLSWVNPANSIVMMNTTGIFNAPVDGTVYTVGTNEVIYVGANTTCGTPVLNSNETYYFAVYAFNGTDDQINYSLDSVGVKATTSQFATVDAIEITNEITFANGTPFNVTVQTLAGITPTASDFARTVTLSQDGNNGTLYGNLTAIIPAGSNTATFSNITFYANAGVSSFTLKVTTGALVDTKEISVPVVAPTTQDKLILFSGVTQTAMTVKWTKGNGTHRILVMRDGAAVTPIAANIMNGNTYEVGTAYSNGTVVYNGTDAQVLVGGTSLTMPYYNTPLVNGHTYYFTAFNYNRPSAPVYCATTGSFNPRSRATVAKDEVAPQDELTESDINNNTFFVSNINPNPVVNTINFKMTNHEEMIMSVSVFDASGREVAKLVDGQLQTKGTKNFSFNLGDNLSSGSYLLVVTAGDQTAVQTFSVVK